MRVLAASSLDTEHDEFVRACSKLNAQIHRATDGFDLVARARSERFALLVLLPSVAGDAAFVRIGLQRAVASPPLWVVEPLEARRSDPGPPAEAWARGLAAQLAVGAEADASSEARRASGWWTSAPDAGRIEEAVRIARHGSYLELLSVDAAALDDELQARRAEIAAWLDVARDGADRDEADAIDEIAGAVDDALAVFGCDVARGLYLAKAPLG